MRNITPTFIDESQKCKPFCRHAPPPLKQMKKTKQTVGLISDTHGLLRQSALDALNGVDLIIHAGDIDEPGILAKLNRIAPVYAVLGNMDRHPGLRHLPRFDMIAVGDLYISIIHDQYQLDLDPAAAGCSVVIYGHSHRPAINKKDGVFYVNPGSAGPRRFKLPISIGFLDINGRECTPRLMEIKE